MNRQRQTGNIYTDLQLQFYPRTTETCELQQTINTHTHTTTHVTCIAGALYELYDYVRPL